MGTLKSNVTRFWVWFPTEVFNPKIYIHGTVRCFGWELLNHQTTGCLRKSLSVERSISPAKRWQFESSKRLYCYCISQKPQTMAGRRCESSGDEPHTNIFKLDSLDWRWGWGVHPFPVFTSQLSGDEGLHVPTPLMTQNLSATTNTIIQCSIMPRMEVVQTMHPWVPTCVLATTSSHH